MQFSKIQSLLAAVILLTAPLVSFAAPAPDAVAIAEPEALAVAEPNLEVREADPQNGGNNGGDSRTLSTCIGNNGNNGHNGNGGNKNGYRACITVTFYRNRPSQVRVRITLQDTNNRDGSAVSGQYYIHRGGNNNNNNNRDQASAVYHASGRNTYTNTQTYRNNGNVQYVYVRGWRSNSPGNKGTSQRIQNPWYRSGSSNGNGNGNSIDDGDHDSDDN